MEGLEGHSNLNFTGDVGNHSTDVEDNCNHHDYEANGNYTEYSSFICAFFLLIVVWVLYTNIENVLL